MNVKNGNLRIFIQNNVKKVEIVGLCILSFSFVISERLSLIQNSLYVKEEWIFIMIMDIYNNDNDDNDFFTFSIKSLIH